MHDKTDGHGQTLTPLFTPTREGQALALLSIASEWRTREQRGCTLAAFLKAGLCRSIARHRYKQCTPYRLGYISGLTGLYFPNPYPDTRPGFGQFLRGIAMGESDREKGKT